MKKKYLFIIFTILILYVTHVNDLVISSIKLPEFKLINDYDKSEEFSKLKEEKLKAFIENKVFIRDINIYSDYDLIQEDFENLSIYINYDANEPIFFVKNFLFKESSYSPIRIIISKNNLRGGSKIRIDHKYYMLSNKDERKLLKIIDSPWWYSK